MLPTEWIYQVRELVTKPEGRVDFHGPVLVWSATAAGAMTAAGEIFARTATPIAVVECHAIYCDACVLETWSIA